MNSFLVPLKCAVEQYHVSLFDADTGNRLPVSWVGYAHDNEEAERRAIAYGRYQLPGVRRIMAHINAE